MQIKIRSYPTHSLEWLKWKWLTILLIILLISIGEDAKATGPLTHFWWEWILFLLPHGLWTTSFLHPWNFSGSWGGLTFHTSGDFPNPGIKLASLSSPALAGGFFTTSAHLGQPLYKISSTYTYLMTSSPLLSVYAGEVKLYAHKMTCPRICTEALFIIDSNIHQR